MHGAVCGCGGLGDHSALIPGVYMGLCVEDKLAEMGDLQNRNLTAVFGSFNLEVLCGVVLAEAVIADVNDLFRHKALGQRQLNGNVLAIEHIVGNRDVLGNLLAINGNGSNRCGGEGQGAGGQVSAFGNDLGGDFNFHLLGLGVCFCNTGSVQNITGISGLFDALYGSIVQYGFNGLFVCGRNVRGDISGHSSSCGNAGLGRRRSGFLEGGGNGNVSGRHGELAILHGYSGFTGSNGDGVQLIAFHGGSGNGDGVAHRSVFGVYGDLAVFDLFIYGNGVDRLLEGGVQNHICLGHCEGISAVLICGDLLRSFAALRGIGQLLQLVAGVGSHCDSNSIVPRECGRCGDGAVGNAVGNGYGIGELLEGGVNGDGLSRHIQRVAIVNGLNRMVLVRALGGVIELLQRIALSGRDGDRNGGADRGGFGLHGDHAVCDALCHCDAIGDRLEGGGNGDRSCGHGERAILIERDLGRALFHGDGA